MKCTGIVNGEKRASSAGVAERSLNDMSAPYHKSNFT